MQQALPFKRFTGYGLLGGAALGALVSVFFGAYFALPWNDSSALGEVGIGPTGIDALVVGLMLSPFTALQGAVIGLAMGVFFWSAVGLLQRAGLLKVG